MSFKPNEKIEALVLKRLIKHLQQRTDVQNIDLMNLANFCRNCLSKWYVEEAKKLNESISLDDAKTMVYGVEYETWKQKYQTEATIEQLEKFKNRKK